MSFDEFGHSKCHKSVIFEVVKIIWALLIHETTAINVLDLLDCEVSCDWVMFIKVNQWDDRLETFTAIPNMAG